MVGISLGKTERGIWLVVYERTPCLYLWCLNNDINIDTTAAILSIIARWAFIMRLMPAPTTHEFERHASFDFIYNFYLIDDFFPSPFIRFLCHLLYGSDNDRRRNGVCCVINISSCKKLVNHGIMRGRQNLWRYIVWFPHHPASASFTMSRYAIVRGRSRCHLITDTILLLPREVNNGLHVNTCEQRAEVEMCQLSPT